MNEVPTRRQSLEEISTIKKKRILAFISLLCRRRIEHATSQRSTSQRNWKRTTLKSYRTRQSFFRRYRGTSSWIEGPFRLR
jgi:hypothetical protein